MTRSIRKSQVNVDFSDASEQQPKCHMTHATAAGPGGRVRAVECGFQEDESPGQTSLTQVTTATTTSEVKCHF